jgi:hypothetical protein
LKNYQPERLFSKAMTTKTNPNMMKLSNPYSGIQMSNGGGAALQMPTQQVTPPTFFAIKDLLMAPFKGFLGSKPENGVSKDPSGKTFFDFSEMDINADVVEFSSFKGKKAILVVNVAS